MKGSDGLRLLARLAEDASVPALAAEADALAERLREGRFYVVCVGQFKRGKSTLLNALSPMGVDAGFGTRSRLSYTNMLTVAPASGGRSLLDALRSRAGRQRASERSAETYLERLLQVNSARIMNDVLERMLEGRRRLEAELRDRLHGLVDSAAQALTRALETRTTGAAAVEAKLGWIAALQSRAEQLGRGDGE